MDIVITQDFFPKIGGAHLWLYEVYRRWPKPVKLLTRASSGNAGEAEAQRAFDSRDHGALEIIRADMAIDDINLLDANCRRRYGSVVKQLRNLAGPEPVTIHCLRAFPEGFAGLLAKLRRPRSTRLVVYAHGEEVLVARASRQLQLMARLVYRMADLVIVNSQSTNALVRGLSPRVRTVCIHPGVDVAQFVRPPEQVAEFRRSWGWPPGTLVVSTIARMEPRKNQAAVLRAIAALRKVGMPLAYVCGGDGEERAALTALATALGIGEWVRFPGALSEDAKVLTYAATDIYAMPSIRSGQMIEGFGIVFIEAAAAGVPSICGKIGGQPEAVVDGETGIVVDGEDDASIQSAIGRLASDAGLREKMGRAAAARARDFDWSKVAKATCAALGVPC